MTLPSGALSMSSVASELGLSLPLNLQHSWVRALAQVTGPSCDFNSLRGKTGQINAAFTTSGSPSNPIILLGYPTLFGGQVYEVSALQTGSGGTGMSLVMTFAGVNDGGPTVIDPPVYSGNFSVTNQTTSNGYVLNKLARGFWGLNTTWNPNIIRPGRTDTFLILPSD